MNGRGTLVGLAAFLIALPAACGQTLGERIDALVNAPEYRPARWGILVVDGTSGRTIYEREADRLFLPASVTKLFTCGTALAELGPDFQFHTPVYRRGEVQDGILHGDLILVASGDLTFGGRRHRSGTIAFTNHDHTYANSGLMNSSLTDTDPLYAFNELARQVARTIREVRGEIFIDERLFPRTRSSGSGPEIVTPMVVNDNVIDLTVTPGARVGAAAQVTLRPATAFIQMDAEIRTVAEQEPTAIMIEPTGTAQFMVRGQIACKSPPVVRIVPVDEPMLFARALFVEALKRQGVRVAASLHRPRRFDLPSLDSPSLVRIADYRSEPLVDVVKVTLKVSHNLYASTLPVLVGLKHGMGTVEAGLKQQARFLRQLGLEPTSVSFSGGAGGQPADSASPRATVAFLAAMAKQPLGKEFFAALPILGVDGTLADVVGPDSPARGKVRAKTGTMAWFDAQNERILLRSKALAGDLETARGTRLFFAIYLNDFPLPRGTTPADQGKVLAKICELIHLHGP